MRKNISALAALAVIMALGVGTAVAEQQQAQVGEPAPNFSLKNQEGETVSLSDFEGQIVVIEWFNYDCPYVVRHYREETFTTLAEKYADEGVVWLAIDSSHDHNVEHNRQVAEQLNLPYPLLDDHTGEVARIYAATHTPHMYVIDREGVLRYAGAIDDDPRGRQEASERTAYTADALAAVVAGSEVATTQTRAYGCTIKFARER